MFIKKCDICGEIIDEDYNISKLFKSAADALTGAPDFRLYNGDHKLDLCDGCKDNLTDWVIKRKNNKEGKT